MCFPVFGHMKKTADNADAAFGCAARRCHSLSLVTCFAAALELPKLFSKAKSNAKAAAKQVRAMRGQ